MAAFIRWRLRAAFIGERLLFVDSCYSMTALSESGFYSRSAFIRGRLVLKGGFYSRTAFIRVLLLFEGGFNSKATFIRGQILFEGGFYSRAAFI